MRNASRSQEELPRRRFVWLARTFGFLLLGVGCVVVGMARQVRVQVEAAEAIARAGGILKYEWRIAGGEALPGDPSTSPVWRWVEDRFGLDALARPIAVQFRPGTASDHVLANVARLGGIRMLDASQSPLVTDVGLAQIVRMRRLERLDLSETDVTGVGLDGLPGLSRLRRFDLAGIPLRPDDIQRLARRFPALETLSVGHAQFGDEHLARVAALRGLGELRVTHGPRVSTVGLEHLRGLRGLRVLVLVDTSVRSLGPLRDHEQLRHLVVSRAPLDDAGIAPIVGLRSLTSLALEDTRIGDAGLRHIEGLDSLESLSLLNRGTTANGLERLVGRLSGLRTVFIPRWLARPEDGVLAVPRPGLTVVPRGRVVPPSTLRGGALPAPAD